MPVSRFRSVEEMSGDRPRAPLDPENLRIACELSELARALGRWSLPPGVRKYRSIEEASRERRRRENREVRERRDHQSR